MESLKDTRKLPTNRKSINRGTMNQTLVSSRRGGNIGKEWVRANFKRDDKSWG